VLLPQLVAGILSVIVINHLVGRSFGPAAGLLAALVMAITPVSVAVDRNNTMDSTLILTLLMAAWAFIKATETGRLRPLLIGAALLGIGFNIKMLEAFLPLPAFIALYLFGAKDRWKRKIKRLTLAMALLAVISLSWVTIVQLTPADQRPYVGSSGNNSEFNLIIGYNGVQRLLGMGFGVSGGARGAAPFTPGFGPPGFGGGGPFGGRGGPGGFNGGMSGTGQAGILRLFTTPLSKEMSWLLPFGLFSLGLVAFRQRVKVPVEPKHQAVILWGGWLLAGAAFFSVAGFFHEYYLAMITAPMAAAFALGVSELWRLSSSHLWLAAVVLIGLAVGTLAFQFVTANAFTQAIGWLPLTFLLFALGVLCLLGALNWGLRGSARLGFGCIVAACLITPGIWSWLTMLNPSQNQSLPAAYSGQTSSVSNGGGIQVNQALLDFLQANTQSNLFLMAVPSSMQGADYVLATGRPVLYLGGFMGSDQVLTSQSLSQLVTSGKLRYVYWDARSGNANGQSDITPWVQANCKAVNGFEVETRNAGAPDGTGAGLNNSIGSGFGNMQVSLYDCLH
jgi:4-amino-4-deoxy-L-arabinose transferase-like glycosyltransferase